MAELLGRMSAAEFNEWRAFYAIEPLGEERGDLQAAAVATMVANVNGNKLKTPAVARSIAAEARTFYEPAPAKRNDLDERLMAALKKKRG